MTTSSCNGFCKGGRVGLDGSHGFGIENAFVAVGTEVKFEVFDGVALALVVARPVPPDPFDLQAAAGWAFCDFLHDSLRISVIYASAACAVYQGLKRW
jgi:hypothetical protein